MAKRTTSTLRIKLYATLLLAACVTLPWVLPAGGCKLDTTPLWGGRTSLDDEDGGSE